MTVTLANFVRGNNLAPKDFDFDDLSNQIAVKTGANSSVKAAIDAAIAAAIAALPADKFVEGLSSYDDTTNVLTLALSDGSTVDLSMTALIADAVASIADASFTTKGIVKLATAVQAAEGLNSTDVLTPLTGRGLVQSLQGVDTFTAHSDVTAGEVVVLRTDGKVEPVGVVTIPEVIGTKTEYKAANVSIRNIASYDPVKDKTVIAAVGTTFSMTVRVASIDAALNKMTYTAEVSAPNVDRASIAYDSTTGKHVIVYRNRSTFDLCARLVTIDSAGVAVLSAEAVLDAGANPFAITLVRSESAGKTVVTYGTNVATISTSGVVPSKSANVTLPVAPSGFWAKSISLDSSKVMWLAATGTPGTNNLTQGVIIDVSGTAPVCGTVFNTNSAGELENLNNAQQAAVFDPTTGLVLYFGSVSSASSLESSYSTITISGTSGTPSAYTLVSKKHAGINFESTANGIFAAWADGSTNGELTLSKIALSSTGVLTESTTAISTASNGYAQIWLVFAAVGGKYAIGFADPSGTVTAAGAAIVYSPVGTESNADTWLGVAKASSSAGTAVPVWLNGGTASTADSLVTGDHCYVEDDGSISNDATSGRYIGRALASNRLRIVECGTRA